MPDYPAIRRLLGGVAVVVVAGLGSGCAGVGKTLKSVIPGSEDAYRSSRNLPPLEVPPDLSSRTIREGLEVPGQSRTRSAKYSDYASGGEGASRGRDREPSPQPRTRSRTTSADDLVASRGPGLSGGGRPTAARNLVRTERSGDKRWLVIGAAREDIWPLVTKFWLDNGFKLAAENPRAGVIETEWVETEVEPPKKGFFGSLTSRFRKKKGPILTRESFSVRLEPGRGGSTSELFISHRQGERKGGDWQPAPPDPAAEAEMLNRLAVAIRAGRRTEAPRLTSRWDRSARAHIVDDGNGGRALALRSNFAQAWARTGKALDRIGFKVQDQDRARGLFFVRYAEAEAKKEGFMSKLGGWLNKEKASSKIFLVSLAGGETVTRLLVLNDRGEPDETGVADEIITLLHEELR